MIPLTAALRQGPSTPSVNKILSTTVQVELPLLQSETGVIRYIVEECTHSLSAYVHGMHVVM